MDKYDKLMVIWALVACVFVAAGTTFSCADDRRQIARAIESGADPVLARCAIKGSGTNTGSTLLCDRALNQ